MTNIAQEMRFVVDVNAGVIVQPQRAVLSKGDANANRIIVTVMDGKQPADLSGVTAAASFYRPPDGAEVPLEAKVEGNEVSALLTDYCYVADGYYEAKIKLLADGARRTILAISGYIHVSGSGAVVDVGDVIPSLDALLEQIQATRDAAKAASEAAQEARTAADTADDAAQAASDAADAANTAAANTPYIGEGGTWYVWDAEADSYMDTGVAATGPKGEQGDAGDNGLTPTIGENGNWFIGGVDTGYPSRGEPGQNGTGSGTVTAVTVNGTKHEPDQTGNVDLGELSSGGGGVPDGGTAGQTLVKQSDADGDAVWQTLDAQDVGALSSDPREAEEADPELAAVPINADTLGGVSASQYALKTDTAPDSEKLGGVAADRYVKAYAAGDVYSNADNSMPLVMNGYITAATKTIRLNGSMPRPIIADTATVESFSAEMRGISGYLNSQDGYIDILANYNVTAYVIDGALTVNIISDTAFTNVTNNTPVVLAAKIGVRFS